MRTLIVLSILLSCPNAFSFWEVVKSSTEKAADTEMLLDAINDLSTTITDENELNQQLETVKRSSKELRGYLSDLNYTSDEIDAILQGDLSRTADLTTSLSRTTRRIQRGKNLIKKLATISAGSPEAVTATQAIDMNRTLGDIHSELLKARMDRELQRDRERASDIERKVTVAKRKAFFARQYELMGARNKEGEAAFFPFNIASNNPGDASSSKEKLKFSFESIFQRGN